MIDHVANRDRMVAALREELVGPSPQGRPIDCGLAIRFDDPKAAYGPWCQEGSGEEILDRDRPATRYGVGVLYPPEVPTEPAEILLPASELPLPPAPDELTDSPDGQVSPQARDVLDQLGEYLVSTSQVELEEFDLSTANSYRPSSLGISFLSLIPGGSRLEVEATGGRYRRKTVLVAGRERTWWLRSSVTLRASFAAADLSVPREAKVPPADASTENIEGLALNIEVFTRPHESGGRLLTVSLVNRTQLSGPPDEGSLFQTTFTAQVVEPEGQPCILPYPGPPAEQLDDEEQGLALLYCAVQTYAVGHGCAADWTLASEGGRAINVRAECLPAFEAPSITPDIRRPDGSLLQVPMAPLAGLLAGENGLAAVEEVVDGYEAWIAGRRAEAPSLEEQYRPAAGRHLDACSRSAERMRAGLRLLREDPLVSRAFELANHAILLQQLRSAREPRRLTMAPRSFTPTFSEPYSAPDPLGGGGSRGRWRPFQIAFILASLDSVARGEAPDRTTVELIWFPTGGGKTEAYLGLTAISIFLRRLRDPKDVGVQVLMRYTLRLLTAQQFQRAAGLFCAMEYLRRKDTVSLGIDEFSVGIWLGGSTTPNRRAEALDILRKLQRGDKFAENKFLVTRCPWCRAQIGPVELPPRTLKTVPRVAGYEQEGNTVRIKCPDPACDFTGGLPIYVIDDDIYERCPSLVIGTVDKFAMLAWRPEARAIFGIGPDGMRITSPPGLIIQDELHLISGPLGSMVGLYEAVIEELCTDRRSVPPVPPKIVSSTATIRRYAEQIRALYGRADTALFPPPGLDAGDSFFSCYDRDPQGQPRRGRLYLGVACSGTGITADRPGAHLRRAAPVPGRARCRGSRSLVDAPDVLQQPPRAGRSPFSFSVGYPGLLPHRPATPRRRLETAIPQRDSRTYRPSAQ